MAQKKIRKNKNARVEIDKFVKWSFLLIVLLAILYGIIRFSGILKEIKLPFT